MTQRDRPVLLPIFIVCIALLAILQRDGVRSGLKRVFEFSGTAAGPRSILDDIADDIAASAGADGGALGWRFRSDTLVIGDVPVLWNTSYGEISATGGVSGVYPTCGIGTVVPNRDASWVLVSLTCFEQMNTVLVFSADGSRWAQVTGHLYGVTGFEGARWASDGFAVEYKTYESMSARVELPRTTAALLPGAQRVSFRVTDVRSDDVLNIRQYATSASAIVFGIPPDGRGVVLNGRIRHADGMSNATGQLWVPVRWGAFSGWVNKRYLVAVIGDPAHEYSCEDDGGCYGH